MTWLRTRYLLKRGWIPEKGKNFMFAQGTRPALCFRICLYSKYEGSFLEVEKLGLEYGHKSPSSIEVYNDWSYTAPLSYTLCRPRREIPFLFTNKLIENPGKQSCPNLLFNPGPCRLQECLRKTVLIYYFTRL